MPSECAAEPSNPSFFYKNVIWTLALFWFLLFNSFDATYLFQYTFMLLYNLVFTSLPVGILGAFDQDTNAAASMAFPQLYKRGILGLDYTRQRFWLYMLDGLYQSAVIFFIPYLVYWDGTTWSASGYDTNGLYDFSSTVAAAGVTAANLYVGINTRYWTIIPALIIPLSTLTVFAWIVIYSYLAALDYYAAVEIIFPTFNFWATVVFTVSVAVGPHWFLRAFRESYLYRDKDIIREAWVGGDLKDQLGIAHRKKRRHRHNVDTEAGAAHPHYIKRSHEAPETRIGQSDPLLNTRFSEVHDSATSSPISPVARQALPPPLLLHDPRPDQDDPLSGTSSNYLWQPSQPSGFDNSVAGYNALPYVSPGLDSDPIPSPRQAHIRPRASPHGSMSGSTPSSRNNSTTDLQRGLSSAPSAFAAAQRRSPLPQPDREVLSGPLDFTAAPRYQRPASEFDENYAGMAM